MALHVGNYLNGMPFGIMFAVSFVWGILSVLLCPCHIAAIPLIIAFINEQKDITIKYAFKLSLMFSLGILVVIAIIGVITGLLGMVIGEGGWVNYFVAAIFILVGLHLLGVINLDLHKSETINYEKRGVFASFVYGLIFGIALSPCTFTFMAPVLAVALKDASKNLVSSCLLLLFYGLGHCAILVFAGTFSEFVFRYTRWTRSSKSSKILKIVCGVLIILAGVHILFEK